MLLSNPTITNGRQMPTACEWRTSTCCAKVFTNPLVFEQVLWATLKKPQNQYGWERGKKNVVKEKHISLSSF